MRQAFRDDHGDRRDPQRSKSRSATGAAWRRCAGERASRRSRRRHSRRAGRHGARYANRERLRGAARACRRTARRGAGHSSMRDATRGGVATVLNEIAEASAVSSRSTNRIHRSETKCAGFARFSDLIRFISPMRARLSSFRRLGSGGRAGGDARSPVRRARLRDRTHCARRTGTRGDADRVRGTTHRRYACGEQLPRIC